MIKHCGESSKMWQAGPLPQAVAIGYSPRAEEAQSGALTRKRSNKERFSMVETRLDVLKVSQGRLLGVESSQEEAESRIDKVESLVDRLTEDTKDSV
ncbi:hypothetical protein B296_00014832 [Ensete ventricosum]|uniref:Uncharacterized protein n=1 Tax=Ensete ventricosum TaxID=4639 RepID=A0A427A832_ENSVE|nr:hypothetical protein B296_00014832 [Ensete ventricosum]